MTVYINKLRSWDTSVISKGSLMIKNILAIYIAGVWVYCVYGLIRGGGHLNKSDIYVVIVEWNSVMINLLWVFTMVLEWKKYKITLSSNK